MTSIPMADAALSREDLSMLAAAVREAQSVGWTTCGVTLEQAAAIAHRFGVEGLPTRPGEAAIASLRPKGTEEAHPHSLSARYGLGVLPLHTDGANHLTPPSVVLLEATAPCGGETLILPLRWVGLTRRQQESMRTGVFLVGRGPRAFYCNAVDGAGRLRFDPGCMRPLDPAARYVSDWLLHAADDAERHSWLRTGGTVVIDNRGALHGRSDVEMHPNREIRRLMLRWEADGDAVRS